MLKPQNRLVQGLAVEQDALKWYQTRCLHDGISRTLIARNYRRKVGEIDLIFEEERLAAPSSEKYEIVFVEVRYRGPHSWQSGIESVGFRKRRRLSLAIRSFLAHYRGPASSVRVDILAWDGTNWEYVPNARLN